MGSDIQPTPADMARDLVADLALCDEATPPPWEVIPPGHGLPSEYLCVQLDEKRIYDTLEMRPADARFIAASRESWPTAIRRAIAAEVEVERLRAAIRKHRDERGDDRCWLDDEELYRALPEGYTPPARDCAVELANCQRFIATRHNPATEYVSPQREIEHLGAVLAEAKGLLHRLVATRKNKRGEGVHAVINAVEEFLWEQGELK